jgi:hypothetical protein
MEKKSKKRSKDLVFLFVVLAFLLIVFLLPELISAISSGSNGDANLTIWTSGTPNGQNVTYGVTFPTKTPEDFNFYFYANFTNSLGFVLNDSLANCSIRFNETGIFLSWENMNFNSSRTLWEFNKSFTYKGNLSFIANCTSEYGNITNLSDAFFIKNTAPKIKNKNEITNDMPTVSCSEDILFIYNFSTNVSEHDINDDLLYSYDVTNTTLLTHTFMLDSSTGILTINITNDTDVGAGSYNFFFEVKDSDNIKDSAKMPITVTTVNDAPVFHNLTDEQFNITERFEKIITVTDEENNVPFRLNITFMNCTTAPWSPRNNTDCTLFNESQYSFNETTGILNISFIASKNDVGLYVTINFSVWDSGSVNLPYNASTSQVVSYNVSNINSPPLFTYVCDNERIGTEESVFTCMINATDIDELSNLTFSTNYSWFTFSNSQNTIKIPFISVEQNFSAIVNFTPDDLQVGNWSVRITVNDTGSPTGLNTTTAWFFINNTEDLVYLDEINNIIIYENTTIFVNATDDDLLVLNKNIKNETLVFASNTSGVDVSRNYTASNYSTARIFINFDALSFGNHSVRINVTDTTGNVAERNFTIRVQSDSPFVWGQTNYTFVVYENNNTYLNLSEYGYDPDENDTITFSYTIDTSFPNFPSNISNGIINFTPIDWDVGQHLLMINAYDGKLDSKVQFNFTILNINDGPYFIPPSNVNTTEDSLTDITIFIYDDDFMIPANQKSFYNESLNLSRVIQGANPNLFNFILFGEPDPSNGRSIYQASFTPNKTDVGVYNITINVTDKSNAGDMRYFNLTISEKEHAPVLSEIGNQTKAINELLYLDFDSTDTEDGNETTPGSNLTYFIENLTTNGNFLIINSSNGIINLTLNQSHAGVWDYNVSVNDSSGMTDSQTLRLTVYDYPQAVYPASNYEFNLKENVSSELVFAFNHSVGMILNDTMDYEVYINGELKNSSVAYGNGGNSTIYITPDFTDETTCTGDVNLTVNISNLKLSKTFDWNITINHTSSPLTFSGPISDTSGIGSVTINLTKYFADVDALDSCINQIVGFSYKLIEGTASGGIVSVSVTNITNASEASISFSATASSSAMYNVTADEYESSEYNSTILNKVTSNNFTINIEVVNPRIVTSTVTRIEIAIIKLILPEPVSADIDDKIILPIKVVNDGKVNLKGIRLFSLVAKDGKLAEDITSFFDINLIDLLEPGQSKDVNLTVNVATKYKGLYEITINATVENPVLNDWGKIYIEVKEGLKIEKRILFLEELIAENPECIEIKEMVNEAREFLNNKNVKAAEAKIDEAIEACKKAIAQPPIPKIKKPTYEKLMNYVVLSSLLALGMGIFYYYFRRLRV